jgi:hypothetical protein
MLFSEIRLKIEVPDDVEFTNDPSFTADLDEDAAFEAMDDLSEKIEGATRALIAELVENGVLPKGTIVVQAGL